MAMHKMARHLKALGISNAECASLIDLAGSALHRIIIQGETPNLRTASRIVAASNGAITYDDLLPAAVKRTNLKYSGRLSL